MLRTITALVSLATMSAALLWQAEQKKTGTLSIEVVDAATGKPLPGVVRVLDADGKPVALEGLLSRGQGLAPDAPLGQWFVVSGAAKCTLPAGKLRIQALSGLETEMASETVDLAAGAEKRVRLALVRFYDARRAGWQSANTHLHLQKLTREEADRYMVEVPRADGLDGLFVSYLERAGDDLEYTSNKYSDLDLARLAEKSGVLIGNGQEHRHNFTPYGEGYGHVMFLNIRRLVQPVSLGPGITKQGTDGIPIGRGIEAARADGATAIWCHNAWGLERVPNWAAERLDAQNIFDGGDHGSYKDSFYRYLNAGFHVPFSTGTDWFVYDFSRVYVRKPASADGGSVDRRLDLAGWLKELSAGRSYITNGPFLEFSVDGQMPGDPLRLNQAGQVRVTARAVGRADFGRIELVKNGEVIATAVSTPEAGHFQAKLELRPTLEEPCWLALRTPPPPADRDTELVRAFPSNEYGRPLFAHTSAVHVEIAGRKVRDAAARKSLAEDLEKARGIALEKGKFSDDQERQRIERVYDAAISALRAP